MLTIMAVLLLTQAQLMARSSGQTAFELNEAARSCMWNDMDSAERYARFALDISPRHSQQNARSGEKGHLGVVGNLCDAMPVQIKACDALLSILLDDGIVGREFHRIAKGITDGSANHATEDLILGVRCKFGILSHGLVHHHYSLDIGFALFVL